MRDMNVQSNLCVRRAKTVWAWASVRLDFDLRMPTDNRVLRAKPVGTNNCATRSSLSLQTTSYLYKIRVLPRIVLSSWLCRVLRVQYLQFRPHPFCLFLLFSSSFDSDSWLASLLSAGSWPILCTSRMTVAIRLWFALPGCRWAAQIRFTASIACEDTGPGVNTTEQRHIIMGVVWMLMPDLRSTLYLYQEVRTILRNTTEREGEGCIACGRSDMLPLPLRMEIFTWNHVLGLIRIETW